MPSTVIATHLSIIIQTHAHELLGHEEVQQLLNSLAKSAPQAGRGSGPQGAAAAAVVRVLQGLLAERVPIRNMRTIIETLAEHAPRTPGPGGAAGQVRIALGRQIVQDIAGISGELPVITLEPDLEQLLQTSCRRRNERATPALEPGLAERLQQRLADRRSARRPRASPRC